MVSTGHFWLNNGGAGHDAAPWKVYRILKFGTYINPKGFFFVASEVTKYQIHCLGMQHKRHTIRAPL